MAKKKRSKEWLEMKKQSDLNVNVYRDNKLIIRNRGKQTKLEK